MNPLLTVIVPNFNYARFLRACLDSAIALEYEPKEIIVVDDGSTDDSASILRQYEAAGQIRAIFKENGGQPDAVNTGFAAARGELIYVLDSDDIVSPHMMQSVLPLWTPKTSKVQFSLESIDQMGRPIGSIFPNYHGERSPARERAAVLATGEYQAPPTSGNVYARWYLEKILPIDGTRFRFSDGPMNAVAPLYGDVTTIATPLGQYRMHGQNQWGRATFNPRVYTTAVKHNLALDAYVVEHGRLLGLPIAPDPSKSAPWAMQYRMASVRLNPDEHPVSESPRAVMGLGLAAVGRSKSLSFAQKAVIIPWFLLMGLGPQRLAEELAKLRFIPAHRPAVLGKTLRMVGALRQTARS